MPSSYAALYYHLVWSTKHRAPLIQPEWRDRLYAYMGGILRERGNKLLIAGGVEDHVHLLCSLGREDSVRDTVQTIKTNSSKWLRSELSHNFHWQDGYGAFTVSPSALAAVERYIRNQAEHHRAHTFEEEIRAISKACGIECDPRFFERYGKLLSSLRDYRDRELSPGDLRPRLFPCVPSGRGIQSPPHACSSDSSNNCLR
jgi:putative transposase